jgi:hypothetical protein
MKSANDFNLKPSLAVLLVGEQKTGKTRTMFAFPDPWILDIDRNLTSGVRVSKGKNFWFDDPYTDAAGKLISEDPKEIPNKQSTHWARAVDLIKLAAKAPEVKALCIDGLAGLCDMLVSHIIYCALKDEGKALDRLRIQDYQPLKTGLTSLIMGLRNTGKVIVFTSHQKADKDELTGRIRYTLNMPGSLNENFGGFFTDVWATHASNIGGKLKYEILTRPSGLHVSLGTSFDIPAAIDITDKDPAAIWSILAPKLT